MRRRRTLPIVPFLPLLVAFVLAAPDPLAAGLSDVEAEAVATGLVNPVGVHQVGDGRYFLPMLDGRILIWEGGALRDDPFLDLGDRILGRGFGLFGLAFHPDYPANGFFFVHYTAKDTGDMVIARFRVSDEPSRADKSSEKVLLSVRKEERLHYGGQLAFGPDGHLYVASGDGTGPERLVDPACASQSLASLEGKILRLDVDGNVDTEPYYAIPADNPFVGAGRGEIWALGLRNPWRFSFDRATGDLWVSDVGQNRREEVSFQPASSPGGENYGWKVMEGHFCLDHRGGCPNTLPPCDDPSFVAPVLQYTHSGDRCSVIGGYVYRGSAVPDLYGRYVYGDYCTGQLWAARRSGNSWESEELPFTVSPSSLTSFGEDADGELLFTAGDTLYRIVDPSVAGGGEDCVADDGHLCLNQGRFEVSVTWRTADDRAGLGHAVPLGDDAGLFWFFSENNPEVFVKLLDACFDPFNHYWVFAAGLTDVETSLVVVDKKTGQVRRYDRPLGASYEAVRDTEAFATCP